MDLRTFVCDMHGGALLAHGWVDGELISNTTLYTLASDAAQGDRSLEFDAPTDNLKPVNNQSLTYKGVDGGYWVVPVKTVTGNVASLRGGLPCAVAAGQNVWKTYQNSSHTSDWGKMAIADYLVRTIKHHYERIYRLVPQPLTSSAVLTRINTTDTFLPCSSEVDAWEVTPAIDTSGAKWDCSLIESGRYMLRFNINTGLQDARLTVQVGQEVPYDNRAFNQQHAGNTDIVINAHSRDLHVTLDGTSKITTGRLGLWKYSGLSLATMNALRIMINGDSWVGQYGFAARLQELLPDATLFQRGHPGWTTAQIDSAFEGDVADCLPLDMVITIAGTNDYAVTSTVPDRVGYYVQQMSGRRLDHLIPYHVVMTPSIGAASIAPDQFNLSRRYWTETALGTQSFSMEYKS